MPTCTQPAPRPRGLPPASGLVQLSEENAVATPWSILVVDDDDVVRSLLCVVLQQEGFLVWTAAGGVEAIDLLRGCGQTIDLVLLDLQMPGMDGLQTFAALRQFNPQIRCCLMSGLLRDSACEAARECEGVLLLPKPFNLVSLGESLRRLLDGAHR